MMDFANKWSIVPTENALTDHHGVSVKLLEKEPPFIGRGEWRLDTKHLEHKHMKHEAQKLISKLKKDLVSYKKKAKKDKPGEERTESIRKEINPQKSWLKYKHGIQEAAKVTQKLQNKALMHELKELEREKQKVIGTMKTTQTIEENNLLREKLREAEIKISNHMSERRKKMDDASAARWFKEDGSGSKAWFNVNKEKPKKQIFHSLIDREGTETQNTNNIMDIAKDHHEILQSRQEMTDEREKAIEKLLSNVTQKIDISERKKLNEKITYQEVSETISRMKTGRTPGRDGIPSEFWKQEIEWRKEEQRNNAKRPDIVNLMKVVLNDIDKHGPEGGSFAEGRMSLLYKKHDKREIKNYRPITLLNTDYKIYTSIMTKRLREIAPKIINEDQAGFMPKRSIYNQIKLTEMTIKFCENEKTNGVIIALDQEKAYDRIDHEYLWRVMSKYNFPESFIRRTQNLYAAAQTAIRLNGCVTEAFEVNRGVRQGDPLSCLLYNIAIEPFFESIRKSNLKGIKVSAEVFNVLLSTYADDTTIYLSEGDDIDVLFECMATFCCASTAKFNENKTEAIPIGDPTFRKEVRIQKALRGKRLPAGTKIAEDDEAIRILGSWQGNNVNAGVKWRNILDTQVKIMGLWMRSYPSLLARARVAKALVVSRALYLMTVNGISADLLKEMEKNIRSFIWLGKKGTIAWERAIRHRSEGGIGAPSVRILYEAVKVMWVKRWLTPTESRHKWAWVANAIMDKCIQKSPEVDKRSITEWIEQEWNIKARSENLTESIKEMIRTAIKYNVKISVLRAPMALKLSMPAFFHPGMKSTRMNNTKGAKCLRKNHAIYTTEDLITFVNRDEEEDECERGITTCKEYAQRMIENLESIWSPITATPIKEKLYHTPRRLEKTRNGNIKGTPILFNPDPLDTEDTLRNVRIFGSQTGYNAPEKKTRTPAPPPQD